jgi:2-keto-3-deoxy-L-rhamnonate aldolase RhmA
MAPIVRPVGNKPEIIAPLLDRGAWGVQVPHVNTADEARAAVDAGKSACSTSTAASAACSSTAADAYLKTMREAACVAQ